MLSVTIGGNMHSAFQITKGSFTKKWLHSKFHILSILLIQLLLSNAHAKMSAAQKAQAIFKATGVNSGLASHLAPSHGDLSMALTNGQKMSVHALALDNKQLQMTRDYLLKTGFYGLASAEVPIQWKELPYAELSLNLAYTDNLEKVLAKGLTLKEIWRTVSPYGAMYLKSNPGKLIAY